MMRQRARALFERWRSATGWKKWSLAVVVLVMMAGGLGGAVSASGIMPIAASSGHWPITSFILHFSMRRSVATHSIGIEPPRDLRDPALVMRGAGHYELGCRFCHGAPGIRSRPVPQAMTPHPPALRGRVRELDAAELFYIVKHGVKFTGMPAWPVQQRDDEVWAVVAFLLELRELDEAGYRELVFGDERLYESAHADAVPEVVLERCARCHGADGQGRVTGAFPRLAGQTRTYLLASLQAYASGDRPSGIMQPVVAALSEDDMQRIATYYASLPPMRPREQDAAPTGQTIAEHGIPSQLIPACAHCHGPKDVPRNEAYPILAGQDARYLREQLELFRTGTRGGSRYAKLMDPVAEHELSSEQIEAVAQFYSTLAAAN